RSNGGANVPNAPNVGLRIRTAVWSLNGKGWNLRIRKSNIPAFLSSFSPSHPPKEPASNTAPNAGKTHNAARVVLLPAHAHQNAAKLSKDEIANNNNSKRCQPKASPRSAATVAPKSA